MPEVQLFAVPLRGTVPAPVTRVASTVIGGGCPGAVTTGLLDAYRSCGRLRVRPHWPVAAGEC